jgi:polysaccharide biosynthesis/export protein
MNSIKPISVSIILILYFFISAACLTGCGKKPPTPEEIEKSIPAASEKINEFNQLMFAATDISSDRGDYLLGPGDLIEIRVFEAEKLNTTVRLSSRGEVSLPFLGEVSLKGMTAAEAERLIEDKYRESYIRDPHVSIFVREHFSQRVTVVGQVKNPGTYDYPSRLRLLDAIVLAGGLNEKAGNEVHVRRVSGGAGEDGIQNVVVDLERLVKEGRTELNITINGGDVIFIPEAGLFYVDGAVRRPGEYRIRGNMTLREAVLSAGGLAGYAKPSKTLLLRRTATGSRTEVEIDLEDADVIEDIVADGDIIYVNSSFWGKVLHGGGVNIGIPGMGVSFHDPEK